MKYSIEVKRTVTFVKEIEAESPDEAESIAHSLEDDDERVTKIDTDDHVEFMQDENGDSYYYSDIKNAWKKYQRKIIRRIK